MGLLRQRVRAWVREVRRAYPSRIDRFKLTDREGIRHTLLHDPEIAAAVAAHVAVQGGSSDHAWGHVREYIEEIVPAFNLLAYYRVGNALARLLIPLFYKVSVGQEARAALNALPPDGSVLYLMNHRSNADYVVVAYVLSGQVAISYAVGEWARIWPLEAVFKSFGSYFVRRRFREPLYHKVLERYVQLITRNGVTQGIFIEGGLTRDGAFREPKLGLLDYLLGVKRGDAFARPLHIIPVAINYDRVLEDRSLLREIQAPDARLTLREQVSEVASYVLKVSVRFVLRRAHRYGRACVNFGPPISVDAWLAENPGVLELPREQRLPRLRALADLVMARIGAVMPVTAVALACTALLQHEGENITRRAWESILTDLRFVLRAAGAPLVQQELSSAELLDRALVMLTLRRLVTPVADGYVIDRSQDLLLRYYANSIAHFLPA
jgi:glycerol-3-phosphate O-acyltransferase